MTVPNRIQRVWGQPIPDGDAVTPFQLPDSVSDTRAREAPQPEEAKHGDPSRPGYRLLHPHGRGTSGTPVQQSFDLSGQPPATTRDQQAVLRSLPYTLGQPDSSQEAVWEGSSNIKAQLSSSTAGSNDPKAPDKIADTIKGFAKLPVAINLDPYALPHVLRDGRFKSQFESHHSNGFLNPEVRSQTEHDAMGVPGDITPKLRPIYGSLKTNPPNESAGQYGSIRVVLKPEVKVRTTYTYGDSLDSDLVPIAVSDAEQDRLSRDRLFAAARPSIVGADLHPDRYGPVEQVEYVEAQIHGGVTLADIDHIEVPSYLVNPGGFAPAIDKDHATLRARLDRSGIPWQEVTA